MNKVPSHRLLPTVARSSEALLACMIALELQKDSNPDHLGMSQNHSKPIWVCLKIVYPYTQWLMIIIPTKWLFHWGYTPFSDIPIFAKLPWNTLNSHLCKVHLYHSTVPFHLHVSYRLPSAAALKASQEEIRCSLVTLDSKAQIACTFLATNIYQLFSTSAALFAKCTEAANLNLS